MPELRRCSSISAVASLAAATGSGGENNIESWP
jgi:hypothetical protein